MRVSDVHYGATTTLELIPAQPGGFGLKVERLDEVRLLRNDATRSPLLSAQNGVCEVRGSDKHQEDALDLILMRDLPRFSWVASFFSDRGIDERIVVQIHEFIGECDWPESIDIGVDEKVVDLMRKKRKRLVSVEEVIGWLSEKLIVRLEDGTIRALVSGSSSTDLNMGSFRLYGNGIVADISPAEEDRLAVTRIVEAKRPRENDEHRPILIVRGGFTFTDFTIAGRFRGSARSQLDELVKNASGYMAMWKEYNSLESNNIMRRAREFGFLRYNTVSMRPDGSWRFHLAIKSGSQNQKVGALSEMNLALRYLEKGEEVQLEATQTPPKELLSEEASILDPQNRGSRSFIGTCVMVDRGQGTIDIRTLQDDEIAPPESGYLSMSLSGDRKRLTRREEAHRKIASAECPMPQLGLIIEGRAVPARRRRQEKGLSPATIQAFGGKPTEKQIEALRIALNTPDIALIQGPPGTGKTRLIAALQSRLAEIDESSDRLSGQALLTSYQHDAVENVANITQVFGLPAIKVGHKWGQVDTEDGFKRWLQERVDKIKKEISESVEQQEAAALKKVRERVIGYIMAPCRGDKAQDLLAEVQGTCSGILPQDLIDRLIDIRKTLQIEMIEAEETLEDIESALAIDALKAIPIDPQEFCENGPKQALKALKRLRRCELLHEDEEESLERVSSLDNDPNTVFLDEIKHVKTKILARFESSKTESKENDNDERIKNLLMEIVDSLNTRTRESASGVDFVLLKYLDDLENDPKSAREAVEDYTLVLAATCQHAASASMSAIKGSGMVFSTVLVDEAARANPLDLFIPISLAERRIILVGDHRQLPHLLEPDIERELEHAFEEETEEALRRSLFERLFEKLKMMEKVDGIERSITLDVQYRMHPILGEFVSDTFYKRYGESFRSGTLASKLTHNIPWYGDAVGVWVDIPAVRGIEEGGLSKFRLAEAKWIAKEAHRVLSEIQGLSVGIITFYAAQVNEIFKELTKYGISEQDESSGYRITSIWREGIDAEGRLQERLRVGTVDAFQGKEFDVVFLSMTRSNRISAVSEKDLRKKYGHLMLENRLCVSMSRQKKLLVVVGDAGMLDHEAAEKVVPGLVKFYGFCGEEHGIRIQA